MQTIVTNLEDEIIRTLLIAALAAALFVARYAAVKLNISITADQRGLLDNLAAQGLQWAFAKEHAIIVAKGWDHVDTKNAVITSAVNYLQANAAPALAKVGIDTSDPEASAVKLTNLLTHNFPWQAKVASDSPATPNTPAQTAALVVATPAPGAANSDTPVSSAA